MAETEALANRGNHLNLGVEGLGKEKEGVDLSFH